MFKNYGADCIRGCSSWCEVYPSGLSWVDEVSVLYPQSGTVVVIPYAGS